MINSLVEIGEQLSESLGQYYSIIGKPKIKENKNNYYLDIIFDLDHEKIIIDESNLYEYSDLRTPLELFYIKTLPRNHSKIYITTELNKVEHLRISLFGKTEKAKEGDFKGFIDKNYPEIKNTEIYNALTRIILLKEFEKMLEKNEIKDSLNLSKNAEIVLVTSSIIDSFLGIEQPKRLSELNGYRQFFENKFFREFDYSDGICYSTGDIRNDVVAGEFVESYNLNKIFVITTINYANNFQKNRFYKNYQLSANNKRYLDVASKYILENLNAYIAGLPHLVVPTFLSKSNIDFQLIEPKISKNIDLAFRGNRIEELDMDIRDEIQDTEKNNIYWLNFIGYKSDGTYFKVTNEIPDIPNLYFNKVMNAFKEVNKDFHQKGLIRYFFNLNSIYKIIPIRIEKVNTNPVLSLVKDILEARKINIQILFDYFSEYILCHKYRRYRSYTNIYGSNSEDRTLNFDYGINDGVINYLLLFKSLLKLNQLGNHNFSEGVNIMPQNNSIDDSINDFFEKMNFSDSQKAMFYLGRMLDSVAYAQYQKEHKQKPVLDKLNYEGMDIDKISRLRLDLWEKAKQYRIVNKIEYNDANFTKYFNYNQWNLKPKESLFFILTGYSFGLATLKERQQQKEEENNE